MNVEDLVERLQEFDLLLDTDPKFPSITGFVADGTEVGSWWAHPQAKQMYRLSCALRDHPDVLLLKLVSGKLTFVHRPLWAAILAIGTAREPWQMDGLSGAAKALLKKVDKERRVSSAGDAVRELETNLLVYSRSVHTEHGHHNKEVQSWDAWAHAARLGAITLDSGEAKAQLEAVVARLNKQFGAKGWLPWLTKQRSSKVRK